MWDMLGRLCNYPRSPAPFPVRFELTLGLTQGEETSFKDGKAESPVRLPCSHVFGKSCLEVLLKPKADKGWGERVCPLCRREIRGISGPFVGTRGSSSDTLDI